VTPSSAVHAVVGAVLDCLLWPVTGLPAEAQAALLGLPAAVLALAVHRRTADQAAIARARDRIKGHLLELRLFRDELGVLLGAQLAILRHNAVYLGHSLVPLAVLLIPFFLLLVQVEARFGWSGLRPGEPLLLTAEVDALGRLADLPVRLEAPGALAPETDVLRIERTRELVWRLGAGASGEHRLTLVVAGRPVELRAVVAAGGPARVSPARYRVDQAGSWTAPAEAPLGAEAPLRAVRLSYPRHGGEWLGLSRASWIFAAATTGFALALRRRFGVEL
jgi:hypothetical protein